MPKFYQEHLIKLAAEDGYYIFFPDFQNSNYPDEIDQSKLVPSKNKKHLYFWYQMVMDTITKKQESSADKFDIHRFPLTPIKVVDSLPEQPSRLPWIIVVAGLARVGVAYWLWHSGAAFA